jgi:putative hydrolase of the HAD superfamily
MPRALLSDIGNVLVSFDFRPAAARFAERCPYSADDVLRRLDPLKVPLESGGLMGEEFVRRGMEIIRFDGSPGEFTAIWCDIFQTNTAMEHTLATLPAALPSYLLSNTSDLHKEHLLREFPVFRHFSSGVYSYLARSMKPDEAIFRTAIDSLGLVPGETLFVDDLAPNIATAQRLGFITHHYDLNRHDAFEGDLRSWLSA